MISNELIQAAIVAKLQANTTLTTFLTNNGATGEIRETQYQGTVFNYPAVRVQVGTQVTEEITSVCYTTNGEVPFTIIGFSEADSSRLCDELGGVVNAALIDSQLTGTGFRSLRILSDGLIKATRTGERIWQSQGLYRCYIYAV